jgi:hypothetical protein
LEWKDTSNNQRKKLKGVHIKACLKRLPSIFKKEEKEENFPSPSTTRKIKQLNF